MSLRALFGAVFGVGLLASTAASPASAQTPLTTIRVAAGLSLPLFVTAPPGDQSRIFIVEQRSGTTGRIRVLQIPSNTLLGTPYLSISPVATDSEQGLLGLAFHPNYNTNGYFWVNYTNSAGNTVIARYRCNPPSSNVADPASATVVLTLTQPFANHNGGWMAFGPDGYLYIAQGDGGSGNDPGNRAQDITSQLLGKILRIDVDGLDNIPGNADDDDFPADANRLYALPPTNPFAGAIVGDDEIWAYGVRNPWRNAFDRLTGELYIDDVGQDAQEEINVQPPGVGGRNYGWRCMEGLLCTGLTGCTCNGANLTLPIWTNNHSASPPCDSTTGGYVYRGCEIPDLQGTYFVAEYCRNWIRSFRYTGTPNPTVTDRTTELAPGGGLSIGSVSSFGEDANGELYICDHGGEIFKIVRANAPSPDCNGNGILDSCDISRGTATDCNNDGIPDSCQPGLAPSISAQPQSESACAGASVTFSVTASGAGTLTYQWRKGGVPIGGATSSSYTINPVTAGDAGTYSVVVTNSCGSVTSANATLSVGGLLGDANCDGLVNNFDIDAFVLGVSLGQAAWEAVYSCDFLCACDIDGSGMVNNFDIDPFVALLVP